ncbi:M10 family metallopeptidase domain-containing protein [Acidobacteria bacterium AH-259-A15]|nr:M10 family metallopeptidase domain-containing protein [Acidobacteria bacterium AH-259-A15]
MKNFTKLLVGLSAAALLLTLSLHAQAQNRETRSRLKDALNPKWTVIIDYINSFEDNKGRRKPKKEPPPPEENNTHLDGHFELIGGVWEDLTPGAAVVGPGLEFSVDLRLFPEGSGQAIQDAFDAWELETPGDLLDPVGGIIFEDVTVGFADGVNTYSMRNLGGGGVLAATFITWDDLNNNNEIDAAEPFIEMDVVHNSTVKWATSPGKGRWWDVQNVATHEIGHVFGLAHPGDVHEEDKRQTMFASAPPKETSKRDLETDGDIPGIQSDFLGYVAP